MVSDGRRGGGPKVGRYKEWKKEERRKHAVNSSAPRVSGRKARQLEIQLAEIIGGGRRIKRFIWEIEKMLKRSLWRKERASW